MRAKAKFNRNAIAAVVISDFQPILWIDGGYFYDEERKAWYHYSFDSYRDFGVKEERTYCGEYFVRKRLPSHKKIQNNKVGIKPHVVLHFIGGHKEARYFDTFEEAETFYNDLTCDVDIL